MSDLQAVTGQLYIVDGVVQDIASGEHAPGLLAQPPAPRAARGRERDFLFVHLTLTGTAADTAVLSANLLNLISQKFYSASGSVTAALRTAVMEANEQLLRYNLGDNHPAREGAITCTVFRQEEVFTIQAGESVALLGHNYGIERMPPTPPAQLTPMGRSRSLDIRYYHHRLQSGDMLLLADPRISNLAIEEFEPALVDSHIEKGLGALTAVIGADSVRLLLVELTADIPLNIPEARPMPPAPEIAVLPPQPRRETTATLSPAPEIEVRKPQPSRPYRTRQQPVPPTNGEGSPSVDRQVIERHARQAGATAALGASRFTAWLADVMMRLRPPQTAATEAESVNWTWAAVIAILIPLVVAAVVTSVYVARDQAQELSNIKTEMNQKLVLAQEAVSPTAARQQYQEILALATQATTLLDPGDTEILRLREMAREELDKLDGVTRLTASALYEYSTGTNLQAVALREGPNGGIYTLDRGNDIVYEHTTDETYLTLTTPEPFALLASGNSVGSHVVGTVIDFIWRPQGFAVQREGLAMLDRDGALVTFQPSIDSLFAVSLDLSIDWVNPVAMTDFDERIYILDTGAGQIWKYFPEGESFIAKADERTILFNDDPDLTHAVDFDIYSEDGSLVLLYGDGRIRYYDTRNGRIEWDEATLLANGLNVPLQNPTAVEIVGRGLNATVFVADAGNGRVVQISRPTGRILAQYRATGPDGEELFTGITDFAVAELPLRLFVSKGNILYTATQE